MDPSPSPPRRRVRLTFDGQPYEGIEGEPLAVSLLAADRLILSRSFRFHRPRGLMCSTGQCGWCECEVDGRPSVRACRVPVRDGLVARGEHAFPSVDRDVFGWLDLGSRWIPPTFYHHRFLRPRALRKRYLDVLRAFGGRGRLRTGAAGRDRAAPDRAAPRGRETRNLEADVLVVGGGPAGIAASEAAAERGVRVVLLESSADSPRPGARVQMLAGTSAVGWYDGVVTAVGAEALWTIRARSVIAATGSYERVPAVRGADRPGVIAARLALQLIERHGILPGTRPLFVGDPADLAVVQAAFARAGATPGGLAPTSALRRVLGRRRVTGAIVAVDDAERRLSVDLVVFSDRTPNLDLILAAGAEVETRVGVVTPVVDDTGRSSVPALFVAGAAAGRQAAGVAGQERARKVGAAAAIAAPEAPAGDLRSETGPSEARAGYAPPAMPSDRTLVCFCEDVHVGEIRAQFAAGYADPELVKRRTGALTGPCQGKYCLQAFVTAMADANPLGQGLPTARPPLQPVRLGDLVPARGPDAADADGPGEM